MWGRGGGGGHHLEQEIATHSSILAWEIPWTEGPGRLQPMGYQRVGHDLATKQQKNGWKPSSKKSEGRSSEQMAELSAHKSQLSPVFVFWFRTPECASSRPEGCAVPISPCCLHPGHAQASLSSFPPWEPGVVLERTGWMLRFFRLLTAALTGSLLHFPEPLLQCFHFLEAPNTHGSQLQSAGDLICFGETGISHSKLL